MYSLVYQISGSLDDWKLVQFWQFYWRGVCYILPLFQVGLEPADLRGSVHMPLIILFLEVHIIDTS